MEPITTQRLLIRQFVETDLAYLLAYHTHPQSYAYQSAPPMDEERAIRFLNKQADPRKWGAAGWRSLSTTLTMPRVIGEVSVFVKPEPESEGDIGWMIHPDYHGRGYATEAAQVVIRFAFEEQ